jgi:hypothetical protein
VALSILLPSIAIGQGVPVRADRVSRIRPSSDWKPNLETLNGFEGKLVLPSRVPWKAAPLESYARYYFGWTENGHHVIVGHLLRGRMTRDAPGINVIVFGDPRIRSTGGGCDQIVLHYNVDDHKMTDLQCYGLG